MVQKNKYPYFVDAKLLPYEIKMRYFLMYQFNPCLKSMLLGCNPFEFDKWFYNCCRQTAIFGRVFLEMYFPEYTYKAYESTMDDKIFDQDVTYEHCFIIATSKEDSNRQILIDMARTTNPLVFEPINENHFYPNVDNYKHLKIISTFEIPFEEVLHENGREYLTGLRTLEAINLLKDMIQEFKVDNINSQIQLTNMVYELPFLKMDKFIKENKELLIGCR